MSRALLRTTVAPTVVAAATGSAVADPVRTSTLGWMINGM